MNQSVEDHIHERLRFHYDDDMIVSIELLAGTYLGLSHTLAALDIDPEGEFVDWGLELL